MSIFEGLADRPERPEESLVDTPLDEDGEAFGFGAEVVTEGGRVLSGTPVCGLISCTDKRMG